MKAGILASDAVTTVSPTYAREILDSRHGELLDDILRRSQERLFGLLNGIDEAVWDPSCDPSLASSFDVDRLDGKRACKASLARDLGLDDGEARPLLVSIGRLLPQKGTDLLASALPALVARGANVVVAGTGEADLVRLLEEAASRAPARIRYLGFVDEEVVHRIVAAGDVLLVPSRFEPCGIVQLYALRYGTIPVARRTGGLVDTIVDAEEEHGTGFLFDAPTAEALLDATVRALHAMASPAWTALQARAMRVNFGWTRQAFAYRELYRRLVSA
jgi:starch synthase